MSNADDEFVARLLDAARADRADDQSQREARLYDHVLADLGGTLPDSERLLVRPTSRWSRIGLAAASIGLAVMTLGGLVWWSSRGQDPTTPPTTKVERVDEPRSVENAVPTPSASAPVAEVAGAAGTSVWQLPAAEASSEKPAVHAPRSETDDMLIELEALEAARTRRRAGDARRALVLLDDFDRRFPRSRLRDEAVVLRVEVLFALGRDEDARRVGGDFVARHPDSLYRARIVQLLGGGG